jgi:uncharacterized membrane protein
MAVLRFFAMLSLVVWVGGIIFFSFVVAPALFSILPTRHLAGAVVTRSLSALHWIGIIAGLVFLVCSFLIAQLATGDPHPLAVRNVLVMVMLALTAISQFVVSTRMSALRTSIGVIDEVPQTDLRRVEFNRLHRCSTLLESCVLLLGLATIFLVAREQSAAAPRRRPIHMIAADTQPQSTHPV